MVVGSSVIAIAQLAAQLTIATGELVKLAGEALPEHEWIEEVAKRNHDLAVDLDAATQVAGP